MGSQKYPDEDKFGQFIAENGGYTNASTDWEWTRYYYSITKEHLAESLDIFGQLFVHPLLSQGGMDREIEAIESEFKGNFTSDSSRILQLLCEEADEGSNVRRFGWGNKKTLKVEGSWEEVKSFWQKEYGAERIKLVVHSAGVESVEKTIKEIYGAIPSRHIEAPNYQISCPHVKSADQ